LVHHDPVRLRDALSWSLDHLKVEGVAVCDTQVEKDIAMKVQTPLVHRLQRRIDVVHDAYVPYCTTEPRFQMEAASRHLGRKFRLPPVVDQGFLERMLSYALQNNWGVQKPKVHAPVLPHAGLIKASVSRYSLARRCMTRPPKAFGPARRPGRR
jgi:hypothetical protein